MFAFIVQDNTDVKENIIYTNTSIINISYNQKNSIQFLSMQIQ